MIDNETIRKVVINKALFPGGGSQEVVKSGESSGVNQTIQFTTNLSKPFHSVNYTIVPAQEGTGDPSPTNPRAIIGYTRVNMILSAPGISKRNIVTFSSTLYGGEGNESGSFEKTYELLTFDGSEAWQEIASGANKRYTLALSDYTPNNAEISDIFKYSPTSTGNFGTFYFAQGIIRIPDGNGTFATLTDFKQWLSENTPSFLLQLATPTTVTVDPITFETFRGSQTARFEEKFPFTIEYLVSESEPANYAPQFLPIFYPDTKERSINHDYS